jgi:UDP-N-acetylglucosamine 2-epimerase (non-hydrolysing)
MSQEETNVFIREDFWQEIENTPKQYAHIVMIATKPDIIKQAPLYQELKNRWELVILVHTGQHYDYNLSSWVLWEFGMIVDVNLNIFWPLHKKFSLIIERLWNFLVELSTEYGKIPIPYVHGDTLTATTADKAAFLNKFSVVHVEAWIRTFTPKKSFYDTLFTQFQKGIFDWNTYYQSLQDESIYEQGSIEPYPEQFDTRWVEASTGYFAAPVELYRRTLLQEWFPSENIEVVWNTIADAVKISAAKKGDSKAFEAYPNMKGKPFIFITIHRRENCEKKERFLAIYYGIKKLIEQWVYVCFLGLHASESAIDRYGLREDIEHLKKTYSQNFAYGPALAHHCEVIDMISVAWAVVTDSGSMQEEANIVWTPCVTVRFWSDRSETIYAGANIIAPPVNSSLIAEIVKGAIGNTAMKKPNLYGENVSKKIVDGVLKKLKHQGTLFQFDDERLGLEKYFDWKI